MEDYNYKPVIPGGEPARRGRAAVLYFAGGVFLLTLAFGARFPVPGIVLSFAALAIGVVMFFSRGLKDKKPGLVIGAAGALGLFCRFGFFVFRPFAGFAIIIGALSLLAAGIWKGIR